MTAAELKVLAEELEPRDSLQLRLLAEIAYQLAVANEREDIVTPALDRVNDCLRDLLTVGGAIAVQLEKRR